MCFIDLKKVRSIFVNVSVWLYPRAKRIPSFLASVKIFELTVLYLSPVRARGLSRQCVLRIHSVSKKATNWGGVSESPYKKGGPVSVLGRAR